MATKQDLIQAVKSKLSNFKSNINNAGYAVRGAGEQIKENVSDFTSSKRNLYNEVDFLSKEAEQIKNPYLRGATNLGLGQARTGAMLLSGYKDASKGAYNIGLNAPMVLNPNSTLEERNYALKQMGGGAFGASMGALQVLGAQFRMSGKGQVTTQAENALFETISNIRQGKPVSNFDFRGNARDMFLSDALGIREDHPMAGLALDIITNLALGKGEDKVWAAVSNPRYKKQLFEALQKGDTKAFKKTLENAVKYAKTYGNYAKSAIKDQRGFANFGADLDSNIDEIRAEPFLQDMRAELDIAEAGKRVSTDNGTIGIPSTYPKWLSDKSRTKESVKAVWDYFESGIVPKGNVKRDAIIEALSELDKRAETKLADSFIEKVSKTQTGKVPEQLPNGKLPETPSQQGVTSGGAFVNKMQGGLPSKNQELNNLESTQKASQLTTQQQLKQPQQRLDQADDKLRPQGQLADNAQTRNSKTAKTPQQIGQTGSQEFQEPLKSNQTYTDSILGQSIGGKFGKNPPVEYLKQQQQMLDDVEKTVSKQTPLNEKVGLLDYLRTPDRVLKKIGLGEQADDLRRAHIKYTQELPTEINKITEWYKQAPDSESATLIFKKLDGQNVELNPTQQKIADEIKAYLVNWADKLKLPKDKRITNYITHIFDDQLIKKEFDEDLAKLIQDNVAGSVYDPFVQKRLGAQGYKENVWEALDAYVKRATRKYNMDPALEGVKEASKNLEITQFKYVKNYIDRVNMRPTEIDTLLDNTVKQLVGYKFGARPVAALSRIARQTLYRGTLGLNIGSAVRNLTQGVNTYSKLGEKYTLLGYSKLLTNGTEELDRVGVLSNNMVEDRSLNATKKFWETLDKGLFSFFELAEKINRGSAYYGAKAKAISEGKSEQEARDYALKIVRDTQFTFGKVDTPVGLQNDLVKLLTQFQSYNIKQIEFLTEMAKSKDVAGMVRYGIGSLVILNTIGNLFGMEWKDLIPAVKIGNENGLVPPVVAPAMNAGKIIIGGKDKYGNELTTKERLIKGGMQLIPYAPAGVQLKKSIEGAGAFGQGYSATDSGNVRFPVEQNPSNLIKNVLFGQYSTQGARDYFDNKRTPLSENQSEYFKQIGSDKSFYDKIMQNRLSNKEEEQLKENLRLEGGATKVKDSYMYYDDDTDQVKKINIQKVLDMPSDTEYNKARKQKEAYALVDDVLNLPKDLQDEAFKKLGIKPEDALYYDTAKQTNDLKTILVRETTQGITDRGQLFQTLVNMRREVNNEMILTSGVIDDLVDEGILSEDEGKTLKDSKVVNGRLVAKMTGRGKKAKLKKIKVDNNPYARAKVPTFKVNAPKFSLPQTSPISAPKINLPQVEAPKYKIKFNL